MSAAALFLHLTALGLTLRAEEDATRPMGYIVRVRGIGDLPPGVRESVRSALRAHRDELVALLISGSPAAMAIRAEAHRYDNALGQDEAA